MNIQPIESGPAWADRASEQFDGYQSANAEAQMTADFLQTAKRGDANALAPWAPLTTDWDAVKRTPVDQRTATRLPKRQQTIAECMTESLDYGNGPSMTEAMQLILAATRSTDTDLALLAGDLVERMARSFATQNT